MAKRKTKVVKAKVKKPRQRKRMSRGAVFPYQVWSCDNDGDYTQWEDFGTELEAQECVEDDTHRLLAPVIVHIDIPPMEY